jgi:BASS family bile acid:Na+ symporter
VEASQVILIAGLAAGHFLGGPKPEERTVLSLASCTRHPAVALALAGSLAEAARLRAALLLYLLVAAAVSAGYVAWQRRAEATPPRDSSLPAT